MTQIVRVLYPDSSDSPKYPDPNPGQFGSPITDQILSVLISDLAYSPPLGIFIFSQLVSELGSLCWAWPLGDYKKMSGEPSLERPVIPTSQDDKDKNKHDDGKPENKK